MHGEFEGSGSVGAPPPPPPRGGTPPPPPGGVPDPFRVTSDLKGHATREAARKSISAARDYLAGGAAGTAGAAGGATPTARAASPVVSGSLRIEALMAPEGVAALQLGPGRPLHLMADPKAKRRKQPFGAPLTQYAMAESYGLQVPQVIVALWSGATFGSLLDPSCPKVNSEGLRTEGIFRLAGDPNACAAAEKAMVKSKGALPKELTPETSAHLIKSFLRSLPGGLLGALPTEVITECKDDEGCHRLLEALAPAERLLLCWLVRVVYEVASYTEDNKMNVRNLTLVLAPNLFGPPNPKANPMEELMLIKAATDTLNTFVSAAMRGTMGRDAPLRKPKVEVASL